MDQNRPLSPQPGPSLSSQGGMPRPSGPAEANAGAAGGSLAGQAGVQVGAPSKIQHSKPGFVIPSAGQPLNQGGAGAGLRAADRGADLDETIRPVSRIGERTGDRLGDEARPLPVTGSPASSLAGATGAKITAFGKEKRHEDCWSRTPNTTGAGAIHVKTFHCKLTDEALVYMDQSINEWLDAHPQYEVKFVSTSIGTFTGKLKEPALICQVWV